MTDHLTKIAACIEARRGPEEAITAREISARTGISERRVRRIISEAPHFQPCRKGGTGYYWPASAEDVYEHDSALRRLEEAQRRQRRLYRTFWERQGIHFPKP